MARAARLSGRVDTVVFAGCVVLALVAAALPNQMRDPVASSLRRTVVYPLVGLQQSAERWRAAWLESDRKIMERDLGRDKTAPLEDKLNEARQLISEALGGLRDRKR